jgi:uncharacterized membrane-anchored protein YitT (DUF2179 family)
MYLLIILICIFDIIIVDLLICWYCGRTGMFVYFICILMNKIIRIIQKKENLLKLNKLIINNNNKQQQQTIVEDSR